MSAIFQEWLDKRLSKFEQKLCFVAEEPLRYQMMSVNIYCSTLCKTCIEHEPLVLKFYSKL